MVSGQMPPMVLGVRRVAQAEWDGQMGLEDEVAADNLGQGGTG